MLKKLWVQLECDFVGIAAAGTLAFGIVAVAAASVVAEQDLAGRLDPAVEINDAVAAADDLDVVVVADDLVHSDIVAGLEVAGIVAGHCGSAAPCCVCQGTGREEEGGRDASWAVGCSVVPRLSPLL